MWYSLSVEGFVLFGVLLILGSFQPTSLKILLPWQSVNSLLMMKILLDSYYSLSVLLLFSSQFPLYVSSFYTFLLNSGYSPWPCQSPMLLGVALGRDYSLWLFLMAMCFVCTFSIFHSVYSCFIVACICFYNSLFFYMRLFFPLSHCLS